MVETPKIKEIDFLPAEYRERYARQQAQPWQIVVAITIIALVVIAAAAQQYRRHLFKKELAAIESAYDTAVSQQNRLAKLKEEAKSADAAAALYTYLRHPWPKTQLLAAIVARLPESVTLQQIQISREMPVGLKTDTQKHVITDQKAEEERLKSLDPAQRDLETLSSKLDKLQTVVVLTGMATDTAALHKYIGELDATEIFDKADLDSFNVVEAGKATQAMQFRVVLSVLPGYGQPGGPMPTEDKNIVLNKTEKP